MTPNQEDYAPPRRAGMPGWGWALIGCLGLPLLGAPILAAILFPVFAQAREKARQTSCLSNCKQMALGTLMYTQDYDEVLPPKDTAWQPMLLPYHRNVKLYRCPSALTEPVSYAMNAEILGKKLKKVPEAETVPLLFDAGAHPPYALAAPTEIAYRHGGKRYGNVAFLDGHAKVQKKRSTE
jgi:prepilin-type processing-associated H-X9-DG protein